MRSTQIILFPDGNFGSCSQCSLVRPCEWESPFAERFPILSTNNLPRHRLGTIVDTRDASLRALPVSKFDLPRGTDSVYEI